MDWLRFLVVVEAGIPKAIGEVVFVISPLARMRHVGEHVLSVALDEPHYYVTVKRETVGRFQSPDYDHLIVAEDALDVLDGWLEDGDKESEK